MESTSITVALQAWSGLLGSWRTRDIGYTPDRVWEITSSWGAQYVLKQIRYDWHKWPDPVRRFVQEARILSYLSHRGVPVAVPVPCDDGRIIARAPDGDLYALTPKLPCRRHPPRTRAGEAATQFNIGAAMARLHVALAHCPYDIESERIAGRRIGSPETWPLLEAGLAPGVVAELVERVGPWHCRIDAALDDPRPQRVHGDLHGGNILIDDDHTVSGIVDVDSLPVAPRIYDLAYNQMFGIEWAYQHDESPDAIEIVTTFKTQHLVGGYNSVSPLTDREVNALPAMTLHTAMGKINFFLAFEGSVRDTWINTARWITDHPETLLPKEFDA